MNEGEALYRGILAEPDDDLRRLIYADWLEENGQPDRARFIRLQIELANYFPDEEPPLLAAEAETLLQRGREHWCPRLPTIELEPHHFRFRKGFAEVIRTSIPLFLRAADHLFDAIPLQGLSTYLSYDAMRSLFESSYWRRLRRFTYANSPLEHEEMNPFAVASLVWLRELELLECRIGPEELRQLLLKDDLGSLARLDLSGNRIGDLGMEILADTPSLRHLRSLCVAGDPAIPYVDCVHASGAAAIAHSPYLTQLELLDLSRQMIGDGGLVQLANSPALSHLRVLRLSHNDIGSIGTSGIEALIHSRYLTQLSTLRLSGNLLHMNGVRELAEWPGLQRLRLLDLAECGITTAGAEILRDSPYRSDHLLLRLHDNPIDPVALIGWHTSPSA